MSNMSQVNSLDYIAIKNVLSRYCEALDLKDFELLEKVFLPDVVADYPFNSDLKSVDALSKAIQNRYVPRSSCVMPMPLTVLDDIQPWTHPYSSQSHNAIHCFPPGRQGCKCRDTFHWSSFRAGTS